MSDLVKRLRGLEVCYQYAQEAADRIEQLERELAEAHRQLERAWTERNHAQSKVDAWQRQVYVEGMKFQDSPGTGWGPGGGDTVSIPQLEPKRLTDLLDQLAAEKALADMLYEAARDYRVSAFWARDKSFIDAHAAYRKARGT